MIVLAAFIASHPHDGFLSIKPPTCTVRIFIIPKNTLLYHITWLCFILLIKTEQSLKIKTVLKAYFFYKK